MILQTGAKNQSNPFLRHSLIQQPLCRRKPTSETPWASPQPGGDPGSTAHSKTPLETPSTDLQTVQYDSWELHPASRPLSSGKGRGEVQDQTSKLGPEQSRLASKHSRKHHHTPHTSSLGQIWNIKIYWHHCIDLGWTLWTKVTISQNSTERQDIHRKGAYLYIFLQLMQSERKFDQMFLSTWAESSLAKLTESMCIA